MNFVTNFVIKIWKCCIYHGFKPISIRVRIPHSPLGTKAANQGFSRKIIGLRLFGWYSSTVQESFGVVEPPYWREEPRCIQCGRREHDVSFMLRFAPGAHCGRVKALDRTPPSPPSAAYKKGCCRQRLLNKEKSFLHSPNIILCQPIHLSIS